MAVDIHLKIDGIPGMSEVSGYEGQIRVSSFAWDMNQATNWDTSTGGSAGRVNVGNFNFTHLVDKATPKLMIACCTASAIKDAVLTCCKASGESSIPYLKVTLRDVIVARVSPTAENQNDTPSESVSLAFREYEVEYQEQDNKGAKKGGPVIVGWDNQKQKKTK